MLFLYRLSNDSLGKAIRTLNFPNKTKSDHLGTLIQPVGKISQVLIYFPRVVNKILVNEDWGVRDTAKIKYRSKSLMNIRFWQKVFFRVLDESNKNQH